MANFLRSLRFDAISFWLGFVAGVLFLFILGKLRPFFAMLRRNMRASAEAAKYEVFLSTEIRLGNDTLRAAQQEHLAAPLFSLDELAIAPRFLAPPPPPLAYEPAHTEDITDWVLPYMPDWPLMASFYGAPTFSLAEALQGDCHLVITGQAGSGKSVALAHLATQVVRHAPETGKYSNHIPLLLHAADLVLPARNPDDLLATLLEALYSYTSTATQVRLPKMLEVVAGQGRLLLLLDGLDELGPPEIDQVTTYLEALLERFPQTRVVTAAIPAQLGSLLRMGFVSLPIAPWTQAQRQEWIAKWSELWERYVGDAGANPLLLVGWLLNNTTNLSPLELTLKVWAAFAGDAIGPTPRDAMEAHLRRMTANRSSKVRPALERLASQMLLSMSLSAEQKAAEGWLAGSGLAAEGEAYAADGDAAAVEAGQEFSEFGGEEPLPEESGQRDKDRNKKDKTPQKSKVRVSGALPRLIECGLVHGRAAERVTLSNPALAGYLASEPLIEGNNASALVHQPEWGGRSLGLRYVAASDPQAAWMGELLQEEDIDTLLSGLLSAAAWLRDAPEKYPWSPNIMRRLALCLQKDPLPFGIKARAVAALVQSGNAGVGALFKQMLSDPHSEIRQLGALALGVQRDARAIPDLARLIRDPAPAVGRAAILALVAIQEEAALEAVADVLLSGEETLRRAAAEALANIPEQGYPTLKEGAQVEDPAVRRAVVYGLARTRQPWAYELIEKLLTQDKQWVVQDAAGQTLEALEHANPRIPQPLPPLTHTPWLIEFAGKRGMGVAPGKPAYDLLFLALKEGDEDQKTAAIYYLTQYVDESAVMPLYQTYFTSRGELREAALLALWQTSASGIPLPPPVQFGLR